MSNVRRLWRDYGVNMRWWNRWPQTIADGLLFDGPAEPELTAHERMEYEKEWLDTRLEDRRIKAEIAVDEAWERSK